MSGLTHAFSNQVRRWSARKGRDFLPHGINRRRIYILPSRSGLMLAMVLVVMIAAGLNYNSNLGLAFAFLVASVALVAMHHCHRNLLGLVIDVDPEVDAIAGGAARFDFVLKNKAAVPRRDLEICCATIEVMLSEVTAQSQECTALRVPVAARGVRTIDYLQLTTRYPFGWFRAWTYVHVPLKVFVAPRPRGGRRPAPKAIGHDTARYETRGDEDFAGLRNYQPGIPLKHMAWKVLARGGEAAVRSYSAQTAGSEWLEWSALEPMETEMRLSQLCRWVMAHESAGARYGLRLPLLAIGPACGSAHYRACLRALALFEGGSMGEL